MVNDHRRHANVMHLHGNWLLHQSETDVDLLVPADDRILRMAVTSTTATATTPLQTGKEPGLFKLDPEAERSARQRLGLHEADAFLARLELLSFDIFEPLERVYGDVVDVTGFVGSLVRDALDAAAARPTALRLLDRRREIDPAWFQRSRMIGYVCYVDRFASSLQGVRQHLDYLAELGVTYLHLMPLFKPRSGDSDGGYAVASYDEVDPRLGTMGDLQTLATELHDRGIVLCIDLVLNHTAREHPWARRALAGEPGYRDMYLIYPDRTQPDRYERSLPEVFPDTAPGNFTQVPGLGWVWTTFHDYQWDLNYANPAVFRAMLKTMFALANRGIDVLRLDAAPFLWKREGTDCQNQPEAHWLVQAFRALTRLAMPGLILKAEAIVGPDMLVQYLGGHDPYRPECDLAYDNQLMVMLWSTLATRDVRLAEQALSRRPAAPRPTAWVCYVRCHDDIGWAVTDTDAASVGLGGAAHRRFLNDFYAGRFPGSYASGAVFQENPATGDARISGTTASLCGIESALAAADRDALTAAIRRLEAMYAVAFSFGGIPLIYMGDELALCNDGRWAGDPARRHDNRWMHRPVMDWAAAARRTDPCSVEGRVFGAIRGLAEARRGLLALRSGGRTTILPTDNRGVLAYRRAHPRSAPFLALTNFSDTAQSVDARIVDRAGLRQPRHVHSTTGELVTSTDRIQLPPWCFTWLSGS
jgi:amylosucrase